MINIAVSPKCAGLETLMLFCSDGESVQYMGVIQLNKVAEFSAFKLVIDHNPHRVLLSSQIMLCIIILHTYVKYTLTLFTRKAGLCALFAPRSELARLVWLGRCLVVKQDLIYLTRRACTLVWVPTPSRDIMVTLPRDARNILVSLASPAEIVPRYIPSLLATACSH